jgi:hypothetical protein
MPGSSLTVNQDYSGVDEDSSAYLFELGGGMFR